MVSNRGGIGSRRAERKESGEIGGGRGAGGAGGDGSGGGCFYKKGGPSDLYRVLYERRASHGRGLSFVRLGSRRANRSRYIGNDVEGGRAQQLGE